MSLASRALDLLPAASVTQAQNHNDNGLADNGHTNDHFGIADANTGRQSTVIDTMAPKEVEEEDRPPYLHVSHRIYFLGHIIWEKIANRSL